MEAKIYWGVKINVFVHDVISIKMLIHFTLLMGLQTENMSPRHWE